MTTAALIASTTNDYIPTYWWLDIHGIRRRYGTGTPSWAPSSDSGTNRVIRPWLTELPGLSGQSIQPLNGSAKGTTFSVSILDSADELTDLFSINKAGTVTELSGSGILKGATSLHVEDASIFSYPCDLFVGLETMRATGQALNVIDVERGKYGSKDVDHLTEDENGVDQMILVSSRTLSMVGRPCTLYEIRPGLVESDAIAFRGFVDSFSEDDGVWTVNVNGRLSMLDKKIGVEVPVVKLALPLWGGLVWGQDWTGDGFGPLHLRMWNPQNDFMPMINDGRSMGFHSFRPATSKGAYGGGLYVANEVTTWFVAIGLEDATAYAKFPSAGVLLIGNEFVRYKSKGTWDDGQSGTGYLAFILDDNESFTSMAVDYPCTTGRGQYSQLTGTKQIGWSSMMAGGVLDLWGSPPIPGMAEHYAGEEIRLVGGFEQFDATLKYNPISITLQILTSTGNGTNGDYDTLDKSLGMGIDQNEIDIAGMLDLQNKYFSDETMTFFFINKVENGYNWLKENVWRPHLLCPMETVDGKFSMTKILTLEEAESETHVAIGHDQLLAMPTLSKSNFPIGQLSIEYNLWPGSGEYTSKAIFNFQNSIQIYGDKAEKYEIKCGSAFDMGGSGKVTTSNGGNLSWLPDPLLGYVATMYNRFAKAPCPEITCEVPYNYLALLPMGSIVALTSTTIPNPLTGTRGMTSVLCQVVETKPNPRRSGVEVTMWCISIYSQNSAKVAASGVVASYSASGGSGGRPRITLQANAYTSLTGGPFTSDVQAFSVGDKIVCLKPGYARSSKPTMEIYNKGTGLSAGTYWIDITGTPAYTPVAGDIIESEEYSSTSTEQKTKWGYTAGTDLLIVADPANVRL